MALSSLAGISGAFSTFEANVEASPVILLRFLIPVIILLIATLAVQRVSKKEKIDSAPTVEQKRERFVVPDDFFNREINHISRDDYDYFLQPMEIQFKRIKEAFDQFKVLDKLYRKYDARTRSSSNRRRIRALEKRKEVFDQILDIYNYLKMLKLSVVEYDEPKRVNK